MCERVYALLTPTFFSSVGFFVVKKKKMDNGRDVRRALRLRYYCQVVHIFVRIEKKKIYGTSGVIVG